MIDLAGSLEGAVFLAQLLYWADRTPDPEGWFYKGDEEWREEVGLSRRQVDKYTKQFKADGFLTTSLRKDPRGTPKTHYKIDEQAFEKYVERTFSKGEAKLDAIEAKEPIIAEPVIEIAPPAPKLVEQEVPQVPLAQAVEAKTQEVKPTPEKQKPAARMQAASTSYRRTTGWRAEANATVDPAIRIPMVNTLERVHGLSSMLSLNDTEDENLLRRLHMMAVKLYRMGYKSATSIETLAELWKTTDFRGKAGNPPVLGPTPDREQFVIFASQQKERAEEKGAQQSGATAGKKYEYFEVDWDAIAAPAAG